MKIAHILAVAIVLTFTLNAQTPEAGKLTITFEPLKERVLVGEPIPVRLVLENKSKADAYIQSRFSTESRTVKLLIEANGGDMIIQNQLNLIVDEQGRMGPQRHTVWPGFKQELREVLDAQLYKYFFRTGKYRLMAIFQTGSDTLFSDWVTLYVDEPTGKDRDAWILINQLTRGDASRISISLLSRASREEFLQKFPEGTYSNYVRFNQAFSLSFTGKDADKKTAVEYLKLLKAVPNFIYAAEVDSKLRELERDLRLR
jgi:hypothetical protein